MKKYCGTVLEAGVAAAMAATKGIFPRNVSVVELQKRLREANVWLG